MAGERRYTRIPPESSGDRIAMKAFYEVGYNNKTIDFAVGQDVSFVTSGLAGTISYVRVDTASTGIIVIDLDQNSNENNLVPTVGEDINVNAVKQAEVATSGYPVYLNLFAVTSGDNPDYVQKVDKQGAAHVRFTEGPAQLDAFGKLRTSQQNILGDYVFSKDIKQNDFDLHTVGSGTITHDSTAGMLLLSATTASGDYSRYTSDLYHHFFPGVSQNIQISGYIGDTGKTNCRRRWGYYDAENGAYFELNGTTLSVGYRSNITGSVVDTTITQVNWNSDVVDGTQSGDNPSGLNLDVTNYNQYWIDISGRFGAQIRWGTYYNGTRITFHSLDMAHGGASTYLKTAALPIRLEQENTGATGSTSEFRVASASVGAENLFDDVRSFGTEVSHINDNFQLGATQNSYVMSFRTTPNSHNVVLPSQIDYLAFTVGNDIQSDGIVKISYYEGGSVANAVWNPIAGGTSNLEIDVTGNPTLGTFMYSRLIKGSLTITMPNISLQSGSWKGKADGTPQVISVVADRLASANTVTVAINHTFRELEQGE